MTCPNKCANGHNCQRRNDCYRWTSEVEKDQNYENFSPESPWPCFWAGDKSEGITLNALDIELAVAKKIGWRSHLIIPNVSWGLFDYEMDMAIVTKSNKLWEVEIKISKADLKADLKKRRQHNDFRLSRLYFAIPKKLMNCIDLIPDRAGVFVVWSQSLAILHRPAIENRLAPDLTEKEIQKLQHLLAMRIWGVKRKLIRMRNN